MLISDQIGMNAIKYNTITFCRWNTGLP